MSLLKRLGAGDHGLVVVPPSHLVVTSDNDDQVVFHDRDAGLGWWFYFFPDQRIDLSPKHAPLLDRDLRRHTRLLFDMMFEGDAERDDLPADLRPRTHDAAWTPLVEAERFEADGGAALSVLHRMQYRPGRESVMGHTLVPVAGGLFEARWMASSGSTGFRESILSIKRTQNTGTLDIQPQAAFDDPAHDADFPQHPVSLARAAKRWHELGTLRITEPPPPSSEGVALLERVGCSVTIPPRYVLHTTFKDPLGVTSMFDRTSFSGTDGIDRLVVTRTNETIRAIAVASRLAKHAEAQSRADFERAGFWGIRCEVTPIEAKPPAVAVVTEGDSRAVGVGRARRVWRWFLDDSGQVWAISISTTIAVPVEDLTAEVTAVARSWRRVT